jgi:hypothetical protein
MPTACKSSLLGVQPFQICRVDAAERSEDTIALVVSMLVKWEVLPVALILDARRDRDLRVGRNALSGSCRLLVRRLWDQVRSFSRLS